MQRGTDAACDQGYLAKQRMLFDRVALLFAVASLLCSLAGCATQKFAKMRAIPLNPLADPLHLFSKSGPSVSPRTEMLLRRYDLLEVYKRDPDNCLLRLQELAENEQGGEKIYAISELAYILGRRSEKAQQLGKALDMYGISGSNAYLYLFSPQMDLARNPYDPQFRGACDLYNGALESSLRLVNKHGTLRPGSSYQVHVDDKTYEIAVVAKGSWKNEDFDHIEFCNDYDVQGLDTTNVTYGIGVPLIAVRRKQAGIDQAEDYYPNGLSFPITALLRVSAPGVHAGSKSDYRHHCVLELHDPLETMDIKLANRLVPMQTDLSTPLAVFLDNKQFRKQTDSTLGLLRPNQTQELRGIYMLEPFDPNRIPVLMVHGLWSSPLTWMPMFNDLRSFQELRQNYQFWFYQYPSGQPFWVSGTQLRNDLAELKARLDPQKQSPALDQMVLVGHSMGGLVSRMQTISSGDEFWRTLSDGSFSDVKGEPEDIAKLEKALFFEPNTSIRRVVTIGTPHRGSVYANDYTRWLGRKIIKLPTTITDTGYSLARQNPTLFRDTGLLTTNTSIDSLSPDSPIFPVMLRAKRAPWVHYHNIIGVVPDEGFFNKLSSGSDGVVTFESAHMDDVQSEIMVQSQHQDIHRTPRAILEVRRILLEHLDLVRNEIRWAQRLEGEPSQAARIQDRSVSQASFTQPQSARYIEGIPMLSNLNPMNRIPGFKNRLWPLSRSKKNSTWIETVTAAESAPPQSNEPAPELDWIRKTRD